MTDPLPETILPNVTCPVCKAPPGQLCVALDLRTFPQGHSERYETTPTHDALAAAPVHEYAVDLEDVKARWLAQCGACDAGLPLLCVCPTEDYRPVMLALVARVEAAESRLASVMAAARGAVFIRTHVTADDPRTRGQWPTTD